jgi:hypothetical protein
MSATRNEFCLPGGASEKRFPAVGTACATKLLPLLLLLTLLATGSLLAQDIIFTNKTATFTNLEGRVYTNVTLVKANRDGLIWSGDGMGVVCYTNLSPVFLKSLGIPAERIEQARARSAQRAASNSKYRAQAAAQAQAQAEAAFIESKLSRVRIFLRKS